MYPNNNRPNENQEETEELVGKEPSEFILGYLTCPQDAAKAFLGALMLTDFRARPLHFSIRFTCPTNEVTADTLWINTKRASQD